jgi:quinolinate synthase
MKMVTLEKLFMALRDEKHLISISKEIAEKAILPITRMLEIK